MHPLRTLAAAGLVALALAGCAHDGEAPLVFGTRLPAGEQSAETAAAPAAAPVLPPLPDLSMNEIATRYVRLVLALGELDEGYVDAYYGPPEWRDEAKAAKLDAAQVEAQAQQLIVRLLAAPADAVAGDAELGALRKSYLKNQLGALSARAAMLQGRKFSFDDEALALYDIAAPHHSEQEFTPALKQLEALLPKGPGTLVQRYNAYLERYAVPRDKLQSVMRAAIGYAQLHVQGHLKLPPGERFELALVGGKPWSAYNWYQGNFYSRIEVNADLPVSIARIIQLASHEGYPGHHVYNGLLEQNLVRAQGWPEYMVYPLYSPQSFIAEGSADYGVELTFPEAQRLNFERELFELAGFDPAQVEAYDRVVRAARALRPAEIEAARRYLDGRMDAESAANWLQIYALASPERARQRIAFIDHYRSYIINYSYGEELVRHHVEHEGGAGESTDAQWQAFARLLSTPRVPTELK